MGRNDSAIEAAKSHDEFLKKIGSKISVIARDGSQVRTNPQVQQQNSMHFVKPLRQRHLPMVALKYRPKTPKQTMQQMRANSNVTRIPNAVIPPVASNDHSTITNLLQKRISENLKAKKLVEDVIASTCYGSRDITKIPIVKRNNSMHGDEDDSIFNLEQREEAKKNKMREMNQLENLVLQKISGWPSWGTDLMRDLTRIVEPLYAADMLRETVKNMGTEEEDNQKPAATSVIDVESLPGEQRSYNFSTKLYDNNATIPASGLFFAAIDTNRQANRSRESNQSNSRQSSRAASSYSEIHRAKSSITIIPSPKSQSALSFHPKIHDDIPDDLTNISYNPAEMEDLNDEGYNNLRHLPQYEDFHEDSGPPLDEIDTLQFEDSDKNHSPVTTQSNLYNVSTDSDASRSITSRTGSAVSKNGNNKKFKPAFFPPADVKLGGLGPDRDNDIYLSKMEKVRKQKEYADNIRKHVLSKPVKIKSSRESPVPTAAPLSIVFEKQTLRLPRIPPRSVSDGSLGEAALTKHQKMKLYANKVKRPSIGTSKSLPDIVNALPPIDRFRHVSAPSKNASLHQPSSPSSHLFQLEQKHLSDLKAVEEIRRHFI